MEDVQQVSDGPEASGRTEGFHKVHFPADQIPLHCTMHHSNVSTGANFRTPLGACRLARTGDYVVVIVDVDDRGRLRGLPIGFSSIEHFDAHFKRDALHVSSAGRLEQALASA